MFLKLELTNVSDYFIRFNLYPNAFRAPQLGLWGVVDKAGHFVMRVSFSQAPGVDAGIGTLGK